MSKPDHEVINELQAFLTSQQYSPVVIRNYCAYARGFLDQLAHRNILLTEVAEAQVERYLHDALALFQYRHGRLPGPRWHQIPCAAIHALLRLAQGQCAVMIASDWCYPAFQFTDGAVDPVMEDVLIAHKEHDPWFVFDVLRAQDDAFGGRSL